MHTFVQKQKPGQQTTSAKPKIPARAYFGQNHKVSSILHMQRTNGDQEVQRMLQADAEKIEGTSACSASTGFGHDFSLIPIFSKSPLQVQTKLTVSASGNVYEREADRVADQVIRMPESQLQYACPCGGGCPTCQSNVAQRLTKDALVQGKHVQENATGVSDAPAIVHEVINSPGQPMDWPTRAFFEPRFGYDFSRVRVHTDTRASVAAQSVQSRAFTFGNNIVFGADEYAPKRWEGKRLLGHELTHVVQQTGRNQTSPFIQRKVQVNSGMTDILGYFRTLCPGTWVSTGSSITGHANAVTNQSCTCLEDTVNDPNRDYTIQVDPVGPYYEQEELYNGRRENILKLTTGPHTEPRANPIIHMSPSRSAIHFGVFNPSGNAFRADNWRILAHELCGHARLNQGYTGVKGDRPEHNSTINTENQIAAEHGDPPRGMYNDRRQGESYHREASDPRLVFKLVDGWHYEPASAIQHPPITTGLRHGTVTASTLRIRQGPSTSTPVVGTYSNGALILIECQTPGSLVDGNSLWDRTDVGYVSDRYVELPSPSSTKLPTCDPMPVPATGVIYGRISTATSELRIRQAPSTSSTVVGSYSRGEMVSILCQTHGTEVLGSTVWDQTDRGYISDRYVERLPPNAIVPTCVP